MASHPTSCCDSEQFKLSQGKRNFPSVLTLRLLGACSLFLKCLQQAGTPASQDLGIFLPCSYLWLVYRISSMAVDTC